MTRRLLTDLLTSSCAEVELLNLLVLILVLILKVLVELRAPVGSTAAATRTVASHQNNPATALKLTQQGLAFFSLLHPQQQQQGTGQATEQDMVYDKKQLQH